MSANLEAASRAFTVTPSDSVDLPQGIAESLYVGVAGTITFIDNVGNQVSTTAIAGRFPIKVKRVLATGTAASSILALY